QARGFVPTTSRHEDNDVSAVGYPVIGVKARRIPTVGPALHNGMTNESRRQTMAGKKRGLEGQKTEEFFPKARKISDARFPPRPRLGGHVMDSRDTERSYFPEQPQGK